MRRLISVIMILIILAPIHVNATDYSEPHKIRCTVYTAKSGAITASGQTVREGIVAGRKEWLGYAVVMYENDNGERGDLIGFYEVLDTGSAETLRNGTSIDVFRPDKESCKEWIAEHGDYVFIQLIPAKG